eukprot:1987453-Rhodomonas_salina.2
MDHGHDELTRLCASLPLPHSFSPTPSLSLSLPLSLSLSLPLSLPPSLVSGDELVSVDDASVENRTLKELSDLTS